MGLKCLGWADDGQEERSAHFYSFCGLFFVDHRHLVRVHELDRSAKKSCKRRRVIWGDTCARHVCAGLITA